MIWDDFLDNCLQKWNYDVEQISKKMEKVIVIGT